MIDRDKIKPAYAIMAHPKRRDRVEKILDKLGRENNVTVFYDNDGLGIWLNARRALLSMLVLAQVNPKPTTHIVLLQDDILVAKKLIEQLPDVLKYVPPRDVLMLCSNHPLSQRADWSDSRWIRTQDVDHGQGLVFPISMIEDFVDFCDWNIRDDYKRYDMRLQIYLKKSGRQAWATIPSLVEHDNPDGSVEYSDEHLEAIRQWVASREGHYTKDLPHSYQWKSYSFIGEENEPVSVDWTKGLSDRAFPLESSTGLGPIEQWACGMLDWNETTMKDKDFELSSLKDPTSTSYFKIPYLTYIEDQRNRNFGWNTPFNS